MANSATCLLLSADITTCISFLCVLFTFHGASIIVVLYSYICWTANGRFRVTTGRFVSMIYPAGGRWPKATRADGVGGPDDVTFASAGYFYGTAYRKAPSLRTYPRTPLSSLLRASPLLSRGRGVILRRFATTYGGDVERTSAV